MNPYAHTSTLSASMSRAGDGPNNYTRSVLEAIDTWVTEDRAPNAIVVTHEGRGLPRPSCPYPQVARLKEPGLDSNDAESFQCVTLTE